VTAIPVRSVRPNRNTRPAPESEGRPSRPRLELVDPRRWRRQRRARVVAVLVGLVIVATPFAVVAMNVMIAQQQFELQRVRSRLDEAQRHNAELAATVSALGAPDNIAKAATAMGMVRSQLVTTLPVVGARAATADPASRFMKDNYPRSKQSLGDTIAP
jgi:hypothetical protein